VPRPADIRAKTILVGLVVLVGLALALGARPARATSDRLVVGTADPALVSALSVAVSSRGLTIVELPDPLHRADDVLAGRREIAAHDAVAIVWLCDDSGAHALCFCDRAGRFVVRHVSVTSPLAPPDAAALALTVKILLWGTSSPPPAPAPPADAAAPGPAPPAVPRATTEVAVERVAPTLAVELAVGARLQPVAAQHAGPRFGLRSVFAPSALDHRLGVGAGLAAGPALAEGATNVSDLALSVFARGRERMRATWLELDAGPSLHLLSRSGAASARSTDLSLDAFFGVLVPVGRVSLGVRAGGFYGLTSSALARWNGEVALTLGFALL
jgi:hypothetical protein